MAGRLDIVTYGENDTHLTLNPEKTFFHKRITKRPNFAINCIDLGLKKEGIGFGKNVKFTLPQNIGHLLKSVTLKIKADDIPDEWNLFYQDGAGVGIIEYADLIIGGTVIERLDSNYITIEKTYFNNSRQQESVENLTGIIPQTTFSSWYGCKKTFSTRLTHKKFDFQIEIPFYFYKSPELALPLCALEKQEVEVEIKFRELKDILFSKTPDLYGEECANFPIPTYYDESWLRSGSPIFLELIKGWDRTVYSYYKFNNTPWYENQGASIGGAALGEGGVGIHRGNTTIKTRGWYPYSDTYAKPSWSMRDFLNDNYGKTYDTISLNEYKWYPERFIETDVTKVFYSSFPNRLNGTISMRIVDGDKEYSKNATLINPYLSTQTLEVLNTVYYDKTTFRSFGFEKTGPNLLNDVYNYEIEAVYGGSDNPFTDIGLQNDLAIPFTWKKRGYIAACNTLGEAWGVRIPYTFTNNPTFHQITTIVNAPERPTGNSLNYPVQAGCGNIRVFIHFPVSDGYHVDWDPNETFSSIGASTHATRIKQIEELETGVKRSSDVFTHSLLELHFLMHSYIEVPVSGTGQKEIFEIVDPIVPPSFNPLGYPIRPSSVPAPFLEFGKVTRISSAGKAIVASLGLGDYFYYLRIFTWYPNKRNGGDEFPGYTFFALNTQKRDNAIGGTYQMVWPNSSIALSRPAAEDSSATSDFQLSDYWETTDFSSTFLDGRTAVQDNGHFAMFWGHVRNITIPYSFIPSKTSNNNRGAVRIYQWNFNDWNTYNNYREDWEKPFSIVQTIQPPDTPSYNYNFGQKLCISRTSQILVVSEPHWVPPDRQTEEDKSNNVDWNVGRIHVYKKVVTTTTTTLLITVSGGKFFVNGVQQDTIELHANKTYTFDQSDPSNAGHPLKFSTTSDGTHAGGTEYTTGVTSNGNAPGGGQSSPALTTFVPPLDIVKTPLYYYCQNHSGMGGSMNITTASGTYELHQTIYPELPSYNDRLKHSRDFQHPLYTSWDDPIQKKWEFGKTMDLSDDDKTLIVGADSDTSLGPNESPNGTVGGWVSIYQVNSSGNFEFKSIVSQKLGDGAQAGFASESIAVSNDGNDIAVSANTADWNPESELPFPDTSYDPLTQFASSQENSECGNIQLFSRDTKTPRNYTDVNVDMTECKLKLELGYLDKTEEVKIRKTPSKHIITQLQRNTFNWREYEGQYYDDDYVQKSQKNQFKLNFCNPVKEMFILTKKNNERALELLQDSNTNTSELCFFQGVTDFDGFVRNYGNRETNYVFTSSKYPQAVMESIKSVSLKLDDEDVIPVDGVGEFPSHFLRALPGSKYHTHVALNRRIYLKSFGINPENWKPTGQLNFSTIKNQLLTVEGFKTGWTHQHDLFVYAKNYNVLKIENGAAHLLYPLYGNGKSGRLRDVKDYPNPNINTLLVGNEAITHERTQIFVDPGIALDPDFTFESSNNLDINTVGTYSFDYNIVSEHGIPNHKAFTRIVNVVDTTAPVISLNFPEQNPIELIFNTNVTPTYSQPYVEFGAVADTGETVTITIFETDANGNNPVEISDIDIERDSYYNVTYSATDSSGNTGTTIRRVIVQEDADAPIVTLNVPSYNNVELFYNIQNNYSETYTEYGASATDIEDGSLSVTTTITRAPIGGGSSVTVTTVDPVVEGFYTVTYSATDTAGNVGTAQRFITVIEDTVAPVITLTNPSANPINLIYNDTVTPTYSQPYIEYGATSDGSEVVTIDSSAVNETTAGTYTVYYSATDRVGIIGTTTRTVIVTLDATPPVLTLTNPSANPINLIFNDTVTPTYIQPYVEFGATADGGETVSIDSSAIQPTTEGTYNVVYSATDIAGNIGTVIRQVIYTRDTSAPIITLNNPSYDGVLLIYNTTNGYSETYTEYGATSDGGETVTLVVRRNGTVVSAVNPTQQGTYVVTYSATDTAGNTGTNTRTITVVNDTVAPVVTLNTPSYNQVDLVYNTSVSPTYSEPYTEYSATAIDAVEGTLSVVKTVTRNGTSVSDVNPIQAGTYTVRYTATDRAGNTGFVERTVIVTLDNVAPTLTLNGSALIRIVQNYSGSLGIPSPPATVNAPDQNLTLNTNDPNSRSVIGTYYIVYSATDRAQNVGSVSRQVNVYSTTTAPSFSLIGGNQTITECGSYTDPGYQNVDFTISNTPTYSTNLNTSLPGTYTASWTSTSPLLGSTQTTTLSRTVTVNAISFTPTSTSNVAYSYYEPIIDNSGYTNYSLRISDVTNSSFSHPNGTITEINRRYLPTCNTQIRASRYLFRQKVDQLFSVAAATIGNSLNTYFGSGRLGGVNKGTVVLYHTFTYRSTSSYLLRLGDLDVYSYNGGTRIRFEWSNSEPALAQIADVSIPGNTPTNQKMIFSVSGQMDRSANVGRAYTGFFSGYRCTYSVYHSYKIRISVYTYNGSSSLTSTELQTGNENDCGIIGGSIMSASNYTGLRYASGTTAAQAEAAAQAAADAIDYRLFRSINTNSALLNIQVLTGSNSDAWNLSDSGTSRACVFTREYNENFE
jgi:hypothetical protein